MQYNTQPDFVGAVVRTTVRKHKKTYRIYDQFGLRCFDPVDHSVRFTHSNHDKEGFNIIDGRVVYDHNNAMYIFIGVREDTKEEVRFYKFTAYEYGNERHIVVDHVKHKVLSLKGQTHFAVGTT